MEGKEEVEHRSGVMDLLAGAEYRTFWPDGSLHWIVASGRPRYEDNEPVRTVGVTPDVTERHLAASALVQSGNDESGADG